MIPQRPDLTVRVSERRIRKRGEKGVEALLMILMTMSFNFLRNPVLDWCCCQTASDVKKECRSEFRKASSHFAIPENKIIEHDHKFQEMENSYAASSHPHL